MANNKPSLIPNSLRNASSNFPYVAESVDIYDKNSEKSQEQINADTYRKGEVYTKTEVDTKDGLLKVDIDDNAENIELIRQEITDVPVTSEVDPYPTPNSTHPVMSGGTYVKNIQAEIVVGDPQGNWNPSTAEEMFERDQARINLLEAELQAAQLAIGAVQTDTVPTEDSPNMLPSGAVFTNCAVAGTKVGEI